MSIRDAIARATSEHHVLFLVTAYLDHLRCSPWSDAAPAHLTALPITGVQDLARRRDVAGALVTMLPQPGGVVHGTIRSCHDVYTLALERIAAVRGRSVPQSVARPRTEALRRTQGPADGGAPLDGTL